MNFGAMGTFMGHEVTHGYDSMGWHFDARGNLKPEVELDKTTMARMGEAMECFVDEYCQYNVGKASFGILFGIRVNGNGQMNASRWPRTLPTTVAFEHRTKLGSCTKQSIQQM